MDFDNRVVRLHPGSLSFGFLLFLAAKNGCTELLLLLVLALLCAQGHNSHYSLTYLGAVRHSKMLSDDHCRRFAVLSTCWTRVSRCSGVPFSSSCCLPRFPRFWNHWCLELGEPQLAVATVGVRCPGRLSDISDSWQSHDGSTMALRHVGAAFWDAHVFSHDWVGHVKKEHKPRKMDETRSVGRHTHKANCKHSIK